MEDDLPLLLSIYHKGMNSEAFLLQTDVVAAHHSLVFNRMTMRRYKGETKHTGGGGGTAWSLLVGPRPGVEGADSAAAVLRESAAASVGVVPSFDVSDFPARADLASESELFFDGFSGDESSIITLQTHRPNVTILRRTSCIKNGNTSALHLHDSRICL